MQLPGAPQNILIILMGRGWVNVGSSYLCGFEEMKQTLGTTMFQASLATHPLPGFLLF